MAESTSAEDRRSPGDATNKPAFVVEIDHQKAAALGVTVAQIESAIPLIFSVLESTIYTSDGQYRVVLETRPATPNDPGPVDALHTLHIRSATGHLIALSNVVRLRPVKTAE